MKIVFFTGSGISQESGIPTFRDRDGLWSDDHQVHLATLSTWTVKMKIKGKELKCEMLRFHNEFRRLIEQCEPNNAHRYIAKLENEHEVIVVTQNVDNLHERAGSSTIYHLHGNLFESRSTVNPNLVYPCNEDINIGDKCEKGSQLRPNVVWFEEKLNSKIVKEATNHIKECNVLVVIGTSLEVSPANTLVNEIADDCKLIVIDPNPNRTVLNKPNFTFIEKSATEGVLDLNEWF